MTPADLSPAALGRISPALSLSLLAELAGTSRHYVSALANGRMPLHPGMAARLTLALAEAQRLAAAGELPERKRMGRPR